MAASISASLPIKPRVPSDHRRQRHPRRHPFCSCPVRSPIVSTGRRGPSLTARAEVSGSATVEGEGGAGAKPAAAQEQQEPTTTGVEEWVGVLKNAAKTRRVPAGEVFAALAAIKRAKVDPSNFLDTLGGSESPGRTWMLIFNAQGRPERGSYFPVTAVQRFDAAVTNQLRALGKEYTNTELVRKVLRSLSPTWHTKATVIEDSKDLTTLKIDELIGSLMTYEINLKRNSEDVKGKKPLALKATNSKKVKIEPMSETSSSSEDNDDEIALLTRKFRKFLRKKNFSSNSNSFSKRNKFPRKNDSFQNKKNDDDVVICYHCRKPGHMRGECPEIKEKVKSRPKERKPRAMVGTWSDEETSTSNSDPENDKDKVCLMALEGQEEEVKQMKEGTFVNQAKYTLEMLKKFKMENSKIISTPMGTNIKMDKDDAGKAVDATMYRGKED